MDNTTLLIVILVVLILFGGGYYGRGRWWLFRALLAHPNSEGMKYAGAAFIALRDEERTDFLTEIERLTTSWADFKSSRLTDAKWCSPKLRVRVKHLAGSKTLRHATVRGWME
jgi:ATP-dependent DNA ligase